MKTFAEFVNEGKLKVKLVKSKKDGLFYLLTADKEEIVLFQKDYDEIKKTAKEIGAVIVGDIENVKDTSKYSEYKQ